jgi:hypothetical protein
MNYLYVLHSIMAPIVTDVDILLNQVDQFFRFFKSLEASTIFYYSSKIVEPIRFAVIKSSSSFELHTIFF